MPLRLAIENEKQLPDGGPMFITVGHGGAVEIGRAQYLDWVLPDANKVVSNKHCEVRWRDDGFYLTDTSTNGTYLNGSEDRVQATVKLKDGDRIAIGHYIVAVALQTDGPPPPPAGLPKAVGLDDLWADADAAPPISADLLRPAPKVASNGDFLNRVADLPWNGPAPGLAPAPLARDRTDDDDWLPRNPSSAPVEPARPVAAEPPRPGPVAAWDEPSTPAGAEPVDSLTDADWSSAVPVPAPPPAPPLRPAAPPAAPPPVEPPPVETPRAPPPAEPVRARAAEPPRPLDEAGGRPARWEEPADAPPRARAADDVVARFAKGAGIPASALAGREGGELAEELGRLMRTVAADLKRLLDARQQAKRALKVSHHTEIAAFENNPLKNQPSIENALAAMLGKPDRTYMGAQACFEASLRDVAEHQIRTFSAMQKAVQMLEKEFDPASLEKDVEHDKSLAARVGFRHSRLWDAYVHRWANRTKYQGDGLTGAFLKDFAKCYDELESSGS